MRRFLAIVIILIGTFQIAIAAGVPEKVEELLPEDTGSAAVAGRFPERPPSEAGYPAEILLKMRQKLSGPLAEPPAAVAEPQKIEGNGH